MLLVGLVKVHRPAVIPQLCCRKIQPKLCWLNKQK